jgi:hypothetical protein
VSSRRDSDRNLLLGIPAPQMDFMSQGTLVAAVQHCMCRPHAACLLAACASLLLGGMAEGNSPDAVVSRNRGEVAPTFFRDAGVAAGAPGQAAWLAACLSLGSARGAALGGRAALRR